tara:strand:+ start:259 stop:1194 length:936 start_codon:yes stop_codon:yes gene_type:complete
MKHIPVMKKESINALNILPSGNYIDATFGFGGHSTEILSKLGDNGALYALDKDLDAINDLDKNILEDRRFTLKHGCFSSIDHYTEDWGIYGLVNGILFDLGVSSYHFDCAERGFSFNGDGEIDMRFDQTKGQTASDWLNNASESDIANVIWKYGEEKFSRRIAREIVRERSNNQIRTTSKLASLINDVVPQTKNKKHKATKTFQAIRIYTNNELDILKKTLFKSYKILAPKGRLVLITYHSLEDKVIKDFIRHTDKKYSTPKDLPIKEEFLTKMFKVVDKFIKPNIEEVEFNPRSRSAKLSILEKVNENND